MKTVPFALAVLVVSLLPSVAHADTLRVPKDYATIQEALDAALSGDTVVVSKGTYNENLTIDGKTDIRLRGKGKAIVSAANPGPALDIANSSEIEVRKLTFSNGTGASGSGIRVTGCDSVKITACTLQDNEDDGVSVESCDDVTVEKCKAYDNGDEGICYFETTNGLITKNKIDGADEKGISVGTNVGLSLETEVSKNRIDNTEEDGIRITGSNVLVEKNRIQGAGDDGITTGDDVMFPVTDIEIIKNRVKLSGDNGISIFGAGVVVERNNVRDSDDDGIKVEGTGNHTICRNKVVHAGNEGFNIKPGAVDNTIERNKVSKVDDDGFDVESTGNMLEKNSAKQSGSNGFEVNASGNTFKMNRAAKSGNFDLEDDAGGNTYDKNKFKTESVDDGS